MNKNIPLKEIPNAKITKFFCTLGVDLPNTIQALLIDIVCLELELV